MDIKIEKIDPKKSILRHMIKHHRYHRRITYDYDLYEIYENNNDIPIGYIIKYNIIGMKTSAYIDIFIREGFRNNGCGSYSLHYFINNIINENNIMVICEDISKSRFLVRNGFIKDKVFIYRNLYRYKKR